ncbi:formylglycine-generating enzyme family protein [Arcticibacter sp. MXS-1]|uniref:formylglycine-generating enzyme family protein n=1 Tax=Arcticibacter sp. MXS-1 TaxID=3341726 RepID=UPI0035A913B8
MFAKSAVIASFLNLSALILSAQDKDFVSYSQEVKGTSLKFDMAAIPGGTFTMGSRPAEKGRREDEGPAHQVNLSPFWIGKYEVTWDLFEPFVYKQYEARLAPGSVSAEVDAVTRPTKPYLDMTFGMGKEGMPAIGMTQHAAILFCKWLYTRTGIFFRLPTEAEWEYACRAGSAEPYSFGSDTARLGEYAWYAANSSAKTHRVGEKKPNAWGLFDMHGNVAEWTADQYMPAFYKQGSNKTLRDPLAKPGKLYPLSVRGGSFADNASSLRSAARRGSDPDWKRIDPQIPKSNWWFPEAPFLGFRVVRPAVPPAKEEIEKYYNTPPIPDY